jgi:hypothetical protein
VPWPSWVVDAVLQGTPENLRRLVRLGIMACQRETDLIRIGPLHKESLRGRGSGVWCRPRKTRRRRRSVFIPLVWCVSLGETSHLDCRAPHLRPRMRLSSIAGQRLRYSLRTLAGRRRLSAIAAISTSTRPAALPIRRPTLGPDGTDGLGRRTPAPSCVSAENLDRKTGCPLRMGD